MRRRFALVASMASLFVLGWWAGRGSTGDLYANLDVFVEVLKRVQENYVDPVPPSQLMDGAVKGMLKDLDPYSEYLDARDFDTLQDATRGTFHGIGVVVGVRDGYPTVISPIESSPAWEAGLHSGDVIVTIDGESSSGLTVDEAAKRLRGPEGTSVKLTVRREGSEEEQDYTLTRREIVTKSVPYAFVVGKDVGYVRLANFSETSGDEVREALGSLRARGARRFVLDVRMNPGGLLTEAVDVAEQFVPKGKLVVYTRGRAKNQDQRFYASETSADVQSPLVVLVDEGSASASEIVAGALQDLDRALVVGRTSFGKGSVQSVFPMRGKTAALKLTTALYYTPVGRSIHKAPVAGLSPDEAADDDEDNAEGKPDTVEARPLFHTAGGRVVYGGGGITPDVPVTSDTLRPLARKIEQRGLAFRFANRWVNTHERPRASAELDPAVWKAFLDYVAAQGVAVEDSSLAAERADLERAVRRELARRTAGDAAAMRVVLEGDPAFQRAIAILERAARPTDVFALGGSTGDRSRDAAH
jgi:carboxyl-terminal processing protease